MATQKERDAIRTRNMLSEVSQWLQNQVPNIGNQEQSTQGDADVDLGYEDENGNWFNYWRAGDGVGDHPIGV